MKNHRAALVLAWTVPLTFGVLAVGAVVRGQPLTGEAFGFMAAILGGIVAGTYTMKNNDKKGDE